MLQLQFSQRKKSPENSKINFLFCKCLAEASVSALDPSCHHLPGHQGRGSLPICIALGIKNPSPPRKIWKGGNHHFSSVFQPPSPQTVLFAYPWPLAMITAKTNKQQKRRPLCSVDEWLTIRLWMKEWEKHLRTIHCVTAPDILGISKHNKTP